MSHSFFTTYKEAALSGRYLTLSHITPLLEALQRKAEVRVAGHSVEGEPISVCVVGHGPVRILLWSQMHGNESTTTKAVFDIVNWLTSDEASAVEARSHCIFCFVPLLNPDGARRYTRENANGVDLNRDMQTCTQPESTLLRKIYDEFAPDWCFNLHDQRTIFGAGDSGKPATVSFLSPAFDEARSVNECRLKAMAVITRMTDMLQAVIPGQVGRFDDGFNLNCAGDTFQHLGTPTILVEAGHFPDDYEREETRKCIFLALLTAIQTIHEIDIVEGVLEKYVDIPQNKTVFFDFVYKNVAINYDNSEIIATFAAQFTERLIEDKVVFEAFIVKIDNLEGYHGHTEFDAQGALLTTPEGQPLQVGLKADFRIGDLDFVNGSIG
ncbi:MAG TPA: M14 metallopeptidase family protein [Flavobacterium sp.]|nr:M14 metallopeptidase family protein [Flavobacterium sp.]